MPIAIAKPPTFTATDWTLAIAFALLMEAGVLTLLATSENKGQIVQREEVAAREAPIAVKPIMDDLPLLKLGGKVKPKLPDMWKKQAPVPVKRYEEKSAPSEKAEDKAEAIPTSKVAERDAEAPPPDAEIVKELDQELLDATPDAEPEVEGEGAADGVKEGTETDPLKARAVSMYLAKIHGWFTIRWRPPVGEIPCDELKKLSTAVSVTVGGDRTVAGYSVSRPSGNATFDAKVRATMDSLIGQQLPPPPPLYPDILGATVSPVFSGAGAKCE
ncbi:MAG TPA: TonB C-terminal domain-containing protein [Polyangiaceae bacterium]|nr:TonB C-terminal domain-containing protein [Polyangiaceae bacterium]